MEETEVERGSIYPRGFQSFPGFGKFVAERDAAIHGPC